MAYVRQNFHNGNILDAGELTHIEEGIIALEKDLEEALSGLPGSVEQATPTISVDANGLITASATQQAGKVSAGTKTATRQLSIQGAKTVTPGRNSQTAVASGRYTTGTVTVEGDTNLVAGNIRKGVSIFDVDGTYEGAGSVAPKLQAKSVTPSETAQTVTPDNGYDGLSNVSVGAISKTHVGSGVTRKSAQTYTPGISDQTITSGQYLSGNQTIKGDANLVANNIRSGVSIFGISGTLSPGAGINAQSKTVTPTKARQTVTPDNGYNSLSSVVVNPIPDNYIEPSGTLDVSSNGTHDVRQYASVNVNVPANGVALPNLNNRGYASDLLSGKELIGPNGEVITGSMVNRGSTSRTLDGIDTTSVSGDAGYYSGISVTFDSSAIEALLNAI